MKNVNNFQIGKVQPQDVAWPLVYFLPMYGNRVAY